MRDRIAHLGPLGALQRQLQPLELGERFGRDDVAADVLRHRRSRAAAALAHPARRFLEGGDADAGGVHQGTDLQVREVTLLFDAAILDNAHVAALAARRPVAANDGAQTPRPAAGLRHPALRLDRPRAGAQLRQRAALAPREQACQAGRAVGERDRHAAGQLVEGRVGSHQQATVVEQHHADRAQVEPVVELAHRAVGTLARGVLGGGVLEHRQVERLARLVGEHLTRGTKPALHAGRVEQPALGAVSRLDSIAGGNQALAVLDRRLSVLLGQQLDEVTPDQRLARHADEGSEGRVDVDEAERPVLQRCRKGRMPEQPQHLVHGAGPGNGRMQVVLRGAEHRWLAATRARPRPAGHAAGPD